MHRISVSKLRSLRPQHKRRSLILLTSVLILLLSASFLGIKVTHAASSYCQVTYSVTNQWTGGFGATLTVQNTSSSAWSSWTLTFTFPASGQTITQIWNGNLSQSGQNVSITNMSYNGSVPAGAFVSSEPGFNGSWTSSNPVPTSFSVNGNVCGGSSNPTPTPNPTNTPTATPTPGSTPTATPSPTPGTPTPTPTPAPPGTHVQNPYAGAQGFLNPNYVSEVQAAANSAGGSLGEKEAQVAQYPTAIWLDSMAAVTGGAGYSSSLLDYLNDAETQAASSSQPIVMTLVIYDLPIRDCSALASNGELTSASDLPTYEHNYIDVIASDLSKPQFANLRISAIIEPDSLPNLITNLSISNCATANSSGVYVQGIQYALNKLHAITNVYNYLDIAHAGWLGWNSNFQPFVNLATSVIKGTTAGVNSVDGFISNTANYTPTTEPYMTANQSIGGQPARSATFFQWNTYIDEQTYDADIKAAFISAGFSSTIGMLIDTSRNGWGGLSRPTGPSTSTDLNTFVNASRIDQRIDWGNWCNQPGGIGARPQANPNSTYAAYVWIKPPGESDGSSSLVPTGPSNPTGKGFDRMCDPTFGGDPLNNNMPTGSMANAPVSGAWFQSGFDTLVGNAFPSFS